MSIRYVEYPANTYSLTELSAMFGVSLNTMSGMIKEIPEITIPQNKSFRRLYYPNEVELIFHKFGTPKKEVRE